MIVVCHIDQTGLEQAYPTAGSVSSHCQEVDKLTSASAMTFENTTAEAQRVVVNLTHANNGNRLDAIALIVTCHASIVLLFEIRVTGEAERAGRWARLDRAGSHVGPSAVKGKCDLACAGVNPRGQVCTRSRDRLPIFLQKSVSLAYLHSKGIKKRERGRSGFKERSVGALGGSYMH